MKIVTKIEGEIMNKRVKFIINALAMVIPFMGINFCGIMVTCGIWVMTQKYGLNYGFFIVSIFLNIGLLLALVHFCVGYYDEYTKLGD